MPALGCGSPLPPRLRITTPAAPALAPAQVIAIDSSRPDRIAVAVAGRGTFTARRVVVAVPLGVMQAGSIRFKPSGLPAANRRALGMLGSGMLNKVRLVAARGTPVDTLCCCVPLLRHQHGGGRHSPLARRACLLPALNTCCAVLLFAPYRWSWCLTGCSGMRMWRPSIASLPPATAPSRKRSTCSPSQVRG